MMEIQGKIYEKNVMVLIDPSSTLSYISPTAIEKYRLKKEKQRKYMLV